VLVMKCEYELPCVSII